MDKQLESYKQSLEIYNGKCENDAEFRALAEKNPEQALNDVGITDVKAFLEHTRNAAEAMSDSDMSAVSGGTSDNTAGSHEWFVSIFPSISFGSFAINSILSAASQYQINISVTEVEE